MLTESSRKQIEEFIESTNQSMDEIKVEFIGMLRIPLRYCAKADETFDAILKTETLADAQNLVRKAKDFEP